MGLVIDTSVLLAALNENDDANARCVALLETTREQLVVPSPVLNELDYWLAKIATVDAWLALCEDIEAGRYELHPLGPREGGCWEPAVEVGEGGGHFAAGTS